MNRRLAIVQATTYDVNGLSVIYPNLDGLGREMNQIWEDRK